MFDGVNRDTLHRWKRSAPPAAPLGMKTLLSPADTSRLSEHIMRVSDVLGLSAVTIRSLCTIGSTQRDSTPAPAWQLQETG